MATPTPEPLFDVEEFWDDLLAFIEGRKVIPVIGPELLTIQQDGRDIPLYRAVAERLLAKYRLDPATCTLRPNNELNDAVCALAAAGKRMKDLYRPVHDIIRTLVDANPDTPVALRRLAAIRHFDLFVTSTPDDMLARAIDAERFGGARQTDQLEYAPKLTTGRGRDLPEVMSSQYAAVFYLYGKADTSPFFAIHDEDALEFPYSLQSGNGPERILSQFRSRNLLIIGCNLPEGLNRFFLRLSNVERLYSDQRAKKEFLVGQAMADDPGFNTFLQRFSQDSRLYPIAAAEFVDELYRRWSERNPALAGAAAGGPSPVDAVDPVDPVDPAIFISYASEDIGAARALHTELQEIAGDVAWFDKQALKSGDDWNHNIAGAIQRCTLFLPLVSAATERRTEGYFRSEWKKAAERSDMIQGRKFLFPIIIDQNSPGGGAYALVPDQFRAYQFSHAPGGRMTEQLRAELSSQLRMLRRQRQA
jgi:hypothetical protein